MVRENEEEVIKLEFDEKIIYKIYYLSRAKSNLNLDHLIIESD
jgi:hypothetical protein